MYDSETDAALETKSTDTSGKLTFDTKLVYGKSYYTLESSVDGFEANTTKYEFSCTEKDQVITKVIENIPAEASITIRKTSSIGTPMKDVVFLLEYSVDDGTSWSSVQKRSDSDPVQAGYCDSADLTADGTLATDENGFICFTGLRQDTQTGDILYRVTEVKTAIRRIKPAFPRSKKRCANLRRIPAKIMLWPRILRMDMPTMQRHPAAMY